MRKIGLILLALVLLAVAAPAMAGDRHRDHRRDYKFDWRIFIPPPPFIFIPTPHPDPDPYPYPPPPPPRGYYGGHWKWETKHNNAPRGSSPRGYYGGHWETRWEWCPYAQRRFQTRQWVDHYPYYGQPYRHHRRW